MGNTCGCGVTSSNQHVRENLACTDEEDRASIDRVHMEKCKGHGNEPDRSLIEAVMTAKKKHHSPCTPDTESSVKRSMRQVDDFEHISVSCGSAGNEETESCDGINSSNATKEIYVPENFKKFKISGLPTNIPNSLQEIVISGGATAENNKTSSTEEIIKDDLVSQLSASQPSILLGTGNSCESASYRFSDRKRRRSSDDGGKNTPKKKYLATRNSFYLNATLFPRTESSNLGGNNDSFHRFLVQKAESRHKHLPYRRLRFGKKRTMKVSVTRNLREKKSLNRENRVNVFEIERKDATVLDFPNDANLSNVECNETYLSESVVPSSEIEQCPVSMEFSTSAITPDGSSHDQECRLLASPSSISSVSINDELDGDEEPRGREEEEREDFKGELKFVVDEEKEDIECTNMENYAAGLDKPLNCNIENVFDLPTSVDEDACILPTSGSPTASPLNSFSYVPPAIVESSASLLVSASLSEKPKVAEYDKHNNCETRGTQIPATKTPSSPTAKSAIRLGINLSLIPPISEIGSDLDTERRSMNQIVPATERRPKRSLAFDGSLALASNESCKKEAGLFSFYTSNRPATAVPMEPRYKCYSTKMTSENEGSDKIIRKTLINKII